MRGGKNGEIFNKKKEKEKVIILFTIIMYGEDVMC